MSTPTFYDSAEKLAALRAAAAALIGTPFFPNSEAPGRDGGIDCVHTLNWIDRTCGVIDRVEIPYQTMDWGQHAERSLLIEAFETWPELRARYTCIWRRTTEAADSKLPEVSAKLLPGDNLCFVEGKVPHHGGKLLENGDLLQALKNPGVHTMRLDAIVRGWRVIGHLAAVYRPLPRQC